MKRFLIMMILVVFSIFAFSDAFAETKTTTFQVSANVIPSCTVSTTAVNFGDSITGSEDVLADGTVTVNCPNGLAYEIGLNEGEHYVTNVRHVHDYASGNNISYLLLYPITYGGGEWGNLCTTGSYPFDCKAAIADGSDQNHIVKGRLYLSSHPGSPPGYYDDTVIVEVKY